MNGGWSLPVKPLPCSHGDQKTDSSLHIGAAIENEGFILMGHGEMPY